MLVYLRSVGDDGVAEPENMGIVDRSQVCMIFYARGDEKVDPEMKHVLYLIRMYVTRVCVENDDSPNFVS